MPKPTLALEYAYGRRSGSLGQGIQSHVCNVWELGSLSNSHHLIDIPIKSHGLLQLHVVIVLDLSVPDRLWSDLEHSLNGLKQSVANYDGNDNIATLKQKIHKIIGLDHSDLSTLDVFPFPVLIIGGKYDRFQDFGESQVYYLKLISFNNRFFLDPEIKKHVSRCLRSVAHTIGASLLYYSSKNTALQRSVRDALNHFGFGQPTNPVRQTAFDYNGPIAIWYGRDSWKEIGVTPSNSERIGLTFSKQIPQVDGDDANDTKTELTDPAKDSGFREPIIDELRSQKDEELLRFIKDSEIRAKFQAVTL